MKKPEYYLFAVFLLFVFLNSCNSNHQVQEANNQIKIVGHRGGGGRNLPENSLAGIRYGLEHNCDIIEIDVQQTADSIVVVNHDKTINRTTDGAGYIKNLTFNDLQQYTLESGNGLPDLNEKIPSLEQVIRLINGRARLLIEIKSGTKLYPGIEKRVVDLIKSNNASNWCTIQSFHTGILLNIYALDPEIELQKVCFGKIPLVPVWLSSGIEFRKVENFGFITGIAVYYRFINKDLIRKIHLARKKIYAWTVDREGNIKKLSEKGVDGIITNYPELVKEIQ